MKKILVVEDEYYARKSIVKILQESDLDIQVCGEAVNGMKAIELLEEYKDFETVELMSHPGYLDQNILNRTSYTIERTIELETLVSRKVKEYIKENNIELLSFSQL